MANKATSDLNQQSNRGSAQQQSGRGVDSPNTTGAGETSTSKPSYGNGQDQQSSSGMKQNKQPRTTDK